MTPTPTLEFKDGLLKFSLLITDQSMMRTAEYELRRLEIDPKPYLTFARKYMDGKYELLENKVQSARILNEMQPVFEFIVKARELQPIDYFISQLQTRTA